MKENESIKSMLEEILREAETGQIHIAKNTEYAWKYYSRFYSFVDGVDRTKNKGYPTLCIRNMDEFAREMAEYLELAREFYSFDREYHDLEEEYDFNKFLTLCLFASADYGDLDDMTKFVRKRKEFLIHAEKPVVMPTMNIGKYYGEASITKNQATLEAPFRFTPKFIDEEMGEEYILPSVLYGMTSNGVVIYAVQGQKNKQVNKVSKDVSRFLRKVNEGAGFHGNIEHRAQGEYEGMDLSEAVKNVSPFALVSLTMFLSLMKERGISHVSAPALLPVRYISERHATLMRAKVYGVEDASPYIQKREDIQKNATDNFMHLFARYCLHFDSSEFDFDDIAHRMELDVRQQEKSGKNILYDIDKIFSSAQLQK